MAFLVSPGVEVKEIDLTGIVPAVSTSIGGYAGHFDWGPIGDLVNISNEGQIAQYFGSPSKANARSFLTAATFLRYGNALLVSRAIDEDVAVNATSGDETPILIRSLQDYKNIAAAILTDNFYARYPGVYGNSLQVMVQPADTAARFNITQLKIVASDDTTSGKAIQITVDDPLQLLEDGSPIAFQAIRSREDWVNDIETYSGDFYIYHEGDNDPYTEGGTTYQYLVCSDWDADGTTATIYDPDSVYPTGYLGDKTPAPDADGSLVLTPSVNTGFLFSPPETIDFESAFVNGPGTSQFAADHQITNDEINVLVIDVDGVFSASPGTILERWNSLSVLADAKREDGSTQYYKEVINTGSRYIIADNLDGIIDFADSDVADVITYDDDGAIVPYAFASSFDSGSVFIARMTGGLSGSASNGDVWQALELLADAETVDVNLLFAENDTEGTITVANRLIRIGESRKDCVVFISPDIEVADQATEDAKLDKVLSKFNRLPSSNYTVFDSTPLYVYDKYHDEYIWIPASGTMAGLCARTDDRRDPWWSPAGYDRGQILGVAKIAYNPLKSHRDELYKSRVNSIIAEAGEGTLLFGDKTAQAKPSAFDRINVRRLFITIEKAIATAAKYSLFEFNDEFTRAQFVNMIAPYLRDVQGRRGITDFRVVCDETNNTGEVIDSNRFVADIYIKPARAINFITLNFVATRTGVEFSEVIGKF